MDTITHDTATPRPEGAAAPTEREKLEEIPLSKIDPSPTNPRKRFDPAKLAELAASISAKGLISPVVLRPVTGSRYELVVGERRFRASKLAGRPTILSVVRTLTDREVCELQLEENGQREDVHPLEEADAYQHLQRQGAALEELAARTGKSAQYVRQRLQYCALGTEAREAFLDGKLTPAVALFVARIPSPKLQADAVKEVLRPQYSGEPMSARAAGEHIRGRYMLRLADAPFNRGDAALIEGVPACGGCPKRTGAQPELFADVESPDTCTDPNCFSAKKDADWQQRVAAAKAKGQTVLSEKDTKKVIPYGHQIERNSGYVDLAEKPYRHDSEVFNGKKSYKGFLGKKDLPPITLARDAEGNVHELVKKEDLTKALKAAGVATDAKKESGSGGRNHEKEAREKKALARRVIDSALTLLAPVVEGRKPDLALWLFLALSILRHGWHDAVALVAKRRGLEGKKNETPEQLVKKAITSAKEPELRGWGGWWRSWRRADRPTATSATG